MRSTSGNHRRSPRSPASPGSPSVRPSRAPSRDSRRSRSSANCEAAAYRRHPAPARDHPRCQARFDDTSSSCASRFSRSQGWPGDPIPMSMNAPCLAEYRGSPVPRGSLRSSTSQAARGAPSPAVQAHRRSARDGEIGQVLEGVGGGRGRITRGPNALTALRPERESKPRSSENLMNRVESALVREHQAIVGKTSTGSDSHSTSTTSQSPSGRTVTISR